MIKTLFVWVWETVGLASRVWWTLKDWYGEVDDLYALGRNTTSQAIAKTEANKWIHPAWMMDGIKANVTWLLTVQDVLDGKSIASDWTKTHSEDPNWEPINFNLCTTLDDNKKNIMKSMLELDLEWRLCQKNENWNLVKSSFWDVIVNQHLKNKMIENWIINQEKYDQSLQILKNYKKLKELPDDISGMLADWVKLTIGVLIDILIIKIMFSVF